GHRASRQGHGEATISRRLALGEVPSKGRSRLMVGGEMLAGCRTGAEDEEET
ncbi:hypothetical protein KI387_007980, partial [Taxus chinensis]